MSAIQRPLKLHGTRSYVAEKAIDSNDIIREAEVDADLDTLYGDYNGGVNDANTVAQAFTGDRIKTGTLPFDRLAGLIGTAQLAVGASTPARQGIAPVANVNTALAEVTIVQWPALTTRGNRVQSSGYAGVWVVSVGIASVLTWRIYRDVTVIQTFLVTTSISGSPANLPVSVAFPHFLDAPGAGTYVYKVTAQTSTLGPVQTSAAPGALWIEEAA